MLSGTIYIVKISLRRVSSFIRYKPDIVVAFEVVERLDQPMSFFR